MQMKSARREALLGVKAKLTALVADLDRQIKTIDADMRMGQQCSTCIHWLGKVCGKYGPVPEDFAKNNTCEDHDDDDIPF